MFCLIIKRSMIIRFELFADVPHGGPALKGPCGGFVCDRGQNCPSPHMEDLYTPFWEGEMCGTSAKIAREE